MTKLDTELLAKLNAAVKEANDAEQSVTTAQAELVSRSEAVGMLLLEAKKLHPKVKDFDSFLKKVHGLKLSRAYDLLRLAGGRTTDEELKRENRERQQKSRAKKKLTKPTLDSVTDAAVTESTRKPSDSERSLAEFQYACNAYLHKLSPVHLTAACDFFHAAVNALRANKKAA